MYVAATVKETDKNRYSVHRVLLTNGEGVVLADLNDKNATLNFGRVLHNEAGTSPTDSGISTDIEPQDANIVNTSEDYFSKGSTISDLSQG